MSEERKTACKWTNKNCLLEVLNVDKKIDCNNCFLYTSTMTESEYKEFITEKIKSLNGDK